MPDTNDGCQFIAEERRGEITFCGAPVHPGSSYCPAHYTRIYMKHSAYVPGVYHVDNLRAFE